MLIFDRFKTRKIAKSFADTVTEQFGLEATVYDSQEASNAVDPFPFPLYPPIVLVERSDVGVEEAVEALVRSFGGTYAGT